MAVLPVFAELRGRPVLVAGGGEGAAWKAELVAAAGAHVSLVRSGDGEAFCEEARELAGRMGANAGPNAGSNAGSGSDAGSGTGSGSGSGSGFDVGAGLDAGTGSDAGGGPPPGERFGTLTLHERFGTLTLHERAWAPADLFGHGDRDALGVASDRPALALIDTGCHAEAAAFAALGRAAGVTVNAIDKPIHGDVTFGSIVNRSPVVVGISTDGAAPILAQAIRRRIETLLPPALARWAGAMRAGRGRVLAMLPDKPARRAFFERLADAAFRLPFPTGATPGASGARPDDAGATPDGSGATPDGSGAVPDVGPILAIAHDAAHAAAHEAAHEAAHDAAHAAAHAGGAAAERPARGHVTLVGAGPGDAELLTLGAVRALQSADVVLFDALVSADVLELARREARRMLVGKRAGRESCRQEDINALMLRLAGEGPGGGRRVVRLKSGDPMVFGRAGEEIGALRDAGIAHEVVPGITSAQGLAASLGMSLTHREAARSVRFVTGHGSNGQLPADLDWRGLADPATTLVVYMGSRTAPLIAERLIAEGTPASTPAIAASSVARPEQRTWRGTLRTLAGGVATLPTDQPILIAIGQAMEQGGGRTAGETAGGSRLESASGTIAGHEVAAV